MAAHRQIQCWRSTQSSVSESAGNWKELWAFLGFWNLSAHPLVTQLPPKGPHFLSLLIFSNSATYWRLNIQVDEPMGAIIQLLVLQKLTVYLVFVLVRVSIAAQKHHEQKSKLGGKGLLGLYFHVAVLHWMKSGQDLGGRNWYRGHEEVLLTDLFPWLVQPVFL